MAKQRKRSSIQQVRRRLSHCKSYLKACRTASRTSRRLARHYGKRVNVCRRKGKFAKCKPMKGRGRYIGPGLYLNH